MKKTIVIITVLVAMVSIAMVQDSPKFGSNLKIGKQADIATIYPWEMTDLETLYVFQNIYEPLARLKRETAEIEPCLATDWQASPDYKTWTFHLRKNVKFHDGSPFTADSVLSTLALRQNFPAKIKKIDEYTVSFSLDKPNAAFAITMSIEYYSIAGPSTIKCFQEKCDKPIINGTGPFKFYNWTPDKEFSMKANENYWGGRPYLDGVTFIPFRNNAELIAALKNGTIHLTHGILPGNISEIRNISDITFQSLPALSIGYLGFNTEKTPFNNPKVRIALAHAINKKEVIDRYFYRGLAGMSAKSCLPAAMFGFYKELPDREYNPQKARLLLKQAGFPNGFEATLLPTGAIRPYMPDPVQIAENIKKYLEAIGIKITIVPARTWKDFLIATFNGTFDLVLFGWIADTVDPNDFLTSMLTAKSIGSTNTVRWSNPAFDDLVERARGEGISDRVKTYQEAQQMFYGEMPFIPLDNAMQLAAWNEKVKGYKIHPAARLYLHSVWLSD